jgi:hypothetical protein
MRIISVFLFSLFVSFFSQATHIRCGHISLRQVGGLTYEIKLTVYTNLNTAVRFADGTLDFGDGTTVNTPTIDNTIRPDLGPQVGIVEYSISHTFPKSGYYKVTYKERNLHAGILNITNSVNTEFYLEASFTLDSGIKYSSPIFLAEPIFKQALGDEFAFSNAAIDVNGNRLSYELVSPLEPNNGGFSLPENFSINYFNGLVSWDTKYKGNFSEGEYLFAMRVTQYDKNEGIIGQLIRTFEINLEPTNNGGSGIKIIDPITDSNNKIFIENGKSKTFKVLAESETNQVEWIESHDPALASNYSFSQTDSISGTKKFKIALVKLSSSDNIIRDAPYPITLRAKLVDLDKQVYFKDVSYLFFTKDIPLTVITGNTELTSEILSYPNPFSAYIKVELSDGHSLNQIEILDSKGQLVVNTSLNEDGNIDTSLFTRGLYILRIRKGSKIFTQKLVKE